jgi:hypothetical protein
MRGRRVEGDAVVLRRLRLGEGDRASSPAQVIMKVLVRWDWLWYFFGVGPLMLFLELIRGRDEGGDGIDLCGVNIRVPLSRILMYSSPSFI